MYEAFKNILGNVRSVVQGGGDRDIYKILTMQQKLKTAPIYITLGGISNCLHEHNHTFSQMHQRMSFNAEGFRNRRIDLSQKGKKS